MKHCVNINDPEFTSLFEQVKELQPDITKEFLASKVAIWQEVHGTDVLPSIEHFNIVKPVKLQDYYNHSIRNSEGELISSKKVLETSKILANTVVRIYNEIKDKISSKEFELSKKSKISIEDLKQHDEEIKNLNDQLKLNNIFDRVHNIIADHSNTLYELLENEVEYKEDYHRVKYNIPNDTKAQDRLYDEYELVYDNYDKYKDYIITYLENVGYKFSKNTLEDVEEYSQEDLDTEGEESAIHTKTYDKSSLEENPRNKLSSKIKWFLHTIPDGSTNHLNLPNFIDFNTVYSDLLTMLSNSGRDQSVMIDIIELESERKPYLKNLLTKLEESSEEFKTSFFGGFINNMNEHVTLIQNEKVIKPIDTVSTSKRKLILDEWSNNVYDTIVYNTDELGKLKVNKEGVEQVLNYFKSITDLDFIEKNFYNDQVSFDNIRTYLSFLGINISQETLSTLKESWNTLSDNKQFRLGKLSSASKANYARKYKKEFEKAQKNNELDKFYSQAHWWSGFNTGFLSRFNDFLKSESEIVYDTENTDEDLAELKLQTISQRERSAKVLAYYESLFNSKLSVENYRTGQGKIIWNHSDPVSMSQEMNRLIDEDGNPQKEYIQSLLQSDFLRESHLLNDLNLPEGHEILEKIIKPHFKIEYLDTLKNYVGKNSEAKLYAEMSDREKIITNLALFSNNKNNQIAKYITPTKSDKHLVQVMTWRKFKSNDFEEVLKIVKSEYSRYYNAQKSKEEFSIEDYSPQLFYFFPDLNNKSVYSYLYTKTGKLKPYTPELGKQIIENLIKPSIQKEVEDTITLLLEEDILQTTEEGNLVFNSNMTGENGISSESTQDFINSFIISSKIALFNSLSVFSGDIAFFSKSKFISDNDLNNTFKHIKSTFDNAFKRLAKDIAPYRPPINNEHLSSIYSQAEKFRVLTVQDPKGTSVNITQLNKIIGDSALNFKSIDSADAIEFVNPKEFAFELYSKSKITLEQYNFLKELFTPDSNGNYKDLTKADKKLLNDIVFTSTKPVISGFKNQTEGGHTYRTPIYIKSSRFPLIPQIFKGTEFEKLNKFMDKHEIASLVMKSAFKIGSKKSVSLYNKDLTITDNILNRTVEEIDDIVHTIDREYFGHQQDIPFNPNKDSILEGSQLSRLMFQGLLTQEKFQKLKQSYDRLHIELLEENWKNFTSEFDVKQDEQGTFVFGNIKKVQDLITKELQTRGEYNENDLLYLELNDQETDFKIPLWAGPNSNKYESLLNSFISKKVLKPKLPGRSYVLVSEAGLKGTSDEIKYTSQDELIGTAYDPETGLKPQRLGYIKGDTKLEEEDYNKLSSKEKEGYTEVVFPAQVILPYSNNNSKKLIGYRIPTQGANSTSAMEVVGFLPNYMGEVVFAPQDFITQMGSDFDIDKLYVHKWGGTNIQNSILDIMWETMTSTERLKDILTPLDSAVDSLKNEVQKIKNQTSEKEYSFISFIQQFKNYNSGVAGKNMIGKSSILSVFLSQIENTNIEIRKLDGYEYGSPLYSDYNWKFKIDDGSIKTTNNISSSNRLDGGSKIFSVSAFQSAAVDNIKELLLNTINYNEHTHNVSSALFSLGVDHLFTAQFISQPIILEHVKNLSNVDTYNDKNFSEAKEDSYTQLFANYEQKLIDFIMSQNYTDSREVAVSMMRDRLSKDGYNWNKAFSTSDLRKARAEENTFEYYADQISLLKKFKELDNFGKRLMDLAYAARVQNRGMGKNLIDSKHAILKIQEILENQIYSNVSNLMDTNSTISGKSFKIVENAFELFSPLYNLDSQLFNSLFAKVSVLKETEIGQLSEKERGQILRFAKSFIFSSDNLSIYEEENIDYLRERLLLSKISREKINKTINGITKTSLKETIERPSLALRWKNYLKTRPNHRFASRFNFEINNGLSPDIIKYYQTQEDNSSSLENIMTVVDMLESDNAEENELAKDLIKYYYITGANLGSTSLVNVIPSGYLLFKNFGEEIKQISKSLEIEDLDNSFIEYVQHYSYLAPSLSEEESSKYSPKGGLIKTSDKLPYIFTLEDKLFYYTGELEGENTYTQIDKKGVLKNNIFEANIKNINSKSLVKRNQSPIDNYDLSAYISSETSNTVKNNIEGDIIIENEEYIAEENLGELALYENDINKTIDLLSESENTLISSVASFLKNNVDIEAVEIEILNDKDFDSQISPLANGAYSNNTIYLRDSIEEEDIETVVLHEIIHSVTDDIIKNEDELSDSSKKILDTLKSSIKIIEDLYKKEYNKSHTGFQSPNEFISEILSDKEFIQNIEKLPFGKTNFLQRIIELISDLITVSFNGKVTNSKEIKRVIESALELIKNKSFKDTGLKTTGLASLNLSQEDIDNLGDELKNLEKDDPDFNYISKDIELEDLNKALPKDYRTKCSF